MAAFACLLHVCHTEFKIPCAFAPDPVRLPPHTLRFAAAGRIACSAAKFDGGTLASVKNKNHSAK
jgi:hypothetical protein